MQCQDCGSEYDLGDHFPKTCSEKHYFCSECQEHHMEDCGGVDEYEEYRKTLTSELTKKCEDFEVKTAEYEKIIDEFKQKFDQEQKKKNVKCSGCGSCESETSVQVCKSCVLDEHETLESFAVKCATELPSAAICAVCAIRDHIKHDHDVLEYFPILSLNQYNSHVENLKSEREESRVMKDQIDVRMDTMKDTFDSGEKELDKMYDMMRRSKTSEIQDNLAAKISQQVGKYNEILLSLENMMAKTNLDYKNSTEELATENSNQSLEDFFAKIGDVYGTNVEKDVSDDGKKKKIVKKNRAKKQLKSNLWKRFKH